MFEIKAWYWLVLGMILVMAEIVIPSFTILWFGLAAMVMALILWVSPGLSLGLQLFLWALASISLTVLWFKCIRIWMDDRTRAGLSLEAVQGRTGMIVKPPSDSAKGMVRFTTPLLGADEWPCICRTSTAPGDRVRVEDVSGNTLIVNPIMEDPS